MTAGVVVSASARLRLRSGAAVGLGILLAVACVSRNQPETPPAPVALPAGAPIIVEVPEPEAQPAGAVLGPVAPRASTGASWTAFHGGPSRQGYSAAPAIRRPHIRWKARVGIQSWLNSPLVEGGRVYVPSSGQAHNSPDPGDGVYAIDLLSGAELWHAHFDEDANGATVADERLFATADDGTVRALDVATGAELWRNASRGKVYSGPLVVGERVLVGDAGGWLRALSVTDGTPAWQLQLVGPIRGGVAADADHVYVVSQGGDAVALTHDGKVVWRKSVTRPPWGGKGREVPIEVYATPVLVDELVVVAFARDTYYAGEPALLALARADGGERWRARGPGDWGNIRSTPAVHGHTLVYSEPYSGDVVGIDARRGTTTFRRTIDTCYFPQWGSPAIAGDVAYVPRFGGTLFAVDVRDGAVHWESYLGDSARAGGPTPDALKSSGCSWELSEGWPLYAPAAIAPDGTVLAGSEQGYLYAIEEARAPGR